MNTMELRNTGKISQKDGGKTGGLSEASRHIPLSFPEFFEFHIKPSLLCLLLRLMMQSRHSCEAVRSGHLATE